MGRLALQLLQSFLGGLGATIVAAVVGHIGTTAAAPPPGGVNPLVWGLISMGLVRLAGFISARFGPKKSVTSSSVPR